MVRLSSKEITQISCIAAILSIFAMIKLPSIIPGMEFQLSAPVSLLILAFFGIKKYFIGGLLSSFILLALGIFNPINIMISIIFRLVAIIIVYIFKTNVFSLIIASVLGSVISRIILSQILDLSLLIILINALPGIIFTILTVVPIYITLNEKSIIKNITE